MKSFIARQPIFDRRQNVYAYELLFRTGLDNYFRDSDPDMATSRVITDAMLLFGQKQMTGGKLAFINFTRDLLLKGYAALLPADWIVVEILEDIEPDSTIVEACRNIKDAGYTLALDDFVYHRKYDPLLELADIIKVDFTISNQDERRKMAQMFLPRGIKLLAEKVETKKEFDEAVEIGYTLMQGYFFARPDILSGKDVPRFKTAYLQMLQEIHRPGLDFDALAEIIQRDVSLSYKLLRYINSAFFGLPTKIHSIKQALVLLGENNVKKWVSLLALAGMGEDKPDELVVSSLIRAHFFESLAGPLGLAHRSSDLFLLGLFSQIDAFLDKPMAEILEEIPLADDVKAALADDERTKLGQLPRLVQAYERGQWEELPILARNQGLDETKIPDLYVASIGRSEQIMTF